MYIIKNDGSVDDVSVMRNCVTGKRANFGSKETIIEVFKKEKIDTDAMSFGNINDRLNNNNILKFY